MENKGAGMMKKNNNKGFTFIELVIYMGILGIFMVAVVTFIGSTLNAYKVNNSRKKLQTQASETYDMVSDMFMAGTEVKIVGSAYIKGTSAGVDTYTQRDGCFVVPADKEKVDKTSGAIIAEGGLAARTESIVNGGSAACYDIAAVKPFTSTDTPSTDEQTMIDVKYLYIKYTSDLTNDGANIYTYCTLKYDETEKKLYVYKTNSNDAGFDEVAASKIYDNSSASDSVVCKNVEQFKLQVNPDTGTFAIILELDDPQTSAQYDMNGVVSLRNSFVLKKHEWK